MKLEYEIYINGTTAEVWRALTEQEMVPRLYHGAQLQCDFIVGHELRYVGPGVAGPHTVHIHGELLDVSPKERLQHVCRVGTAYGQVHANFASRITYELEALGGCTKLKVTHDQWQQGDPSFENTRQGWWRLLSSLKSLVETGETLRLPEQAHTVTHSTETKEASAAP